MSEARSFAFADGKDPDAFRTIGEVAQAFGLKQHVLRYWEEQFPMLKPLKRSGGRRYYRPEDVRLVAEISRLLYREGFTIRGARQALKAGNPVPGDPLAGAAPPADESPTFSVKGNTPEIERPGEMLVRLDPPPSFEDSAALCSRLSDLRSRLAEALDRA